jgi:protein arginine kinase activator
MLCQRCHKNLATVRYAEVIDGKVTDRHLCESCMTQYQEGQGTGFALTSTPTTARRPAAQGIFRESVPEQRRCPTCGIMLTEIVALHIVGCSQCYTQFRGEIDTILRETHRAGAHRGKNPRVNDDRARQRQSLQSKRTLLRSMLRREKYEEAALLRDDIHSMEAGLLQTEGEGK